MLGPFVQKHFFLSTKNVSVSQLHNICNDIIPVVDPCRKHVINYPISVVMYNPITPHTLASDLRYAANLNCQFVVKPVIGESSKKDPPCYLIALTLLWVLIALLFMASCVRHLKCFEYSSTCSWEVAYNGSLFESNGLYTMYTHVSYMRAIDW